jgi:phosphopantothenoylcysteine decarboxylase/phosphopantothenate--cysteine ligase
MAEPRKQPNVVVGVCGSIAAYKACEIVRRLLALGVRVDAVLTRSATELVAPRTFAALTGNRVSVDPFRDPPPEAIEHISLADRADVVLVAPATANTIAKLAAGICDDMLTTTVCATSAPVLVAPAMNPRMWAHPATVRNAATLESFGYRIISPESGEMACGHVGEGRLADVDVVVAEVERALAAHDLEGRNVLITVGPTREPLDPVRFISNRSSGKMGLAIARAAWLAGARVTCVAGPLSCPEPYGPEIVRAETSEEMRRAVLDRLPGTDVLFAVAAVADFVPAASQESKIKKADLEGLVLSLGPAPDILAEVCASAARPRLVVGFAAETHDVEAGARAKLWRKGCDWIVANPVGPGGVMGSDDTEVAVVAGGAEPTRLSGPKSDVARELVRLAALHLADTRVPRSGRE